MTGAVSSEGTTLGSGGRVRESAKRSRGKEEKWGERGGLFWGAEVPAVAGQPLRCAMAGGGSRAGEKKRKDTLTGKVVGAPLIGEQESRYGGDSGFPGSRGKEGTGVGRPGEGGQEA